jgi:dolichol kinase
MCLSGFSIVLIEILKRRYRWDAHLTRRVIHVITALVALFASLVVEKEIIIAVSLLFVLVLFLVRERGIFSSIHAVDRRSFGDVFLPLGVAASALLFLPDLHAFQFGIAVMGIADPIAGAIGERWGKHPLSFFGNKKTIEGSIVFFLTSVILSFVFIPIHAVSLMGVSFALTAVESISVLGIDNLLLPIAAGFLLEMLLRMP